MRELVEGKWSDSGIGFETRPTI